MIDREDYLVEYEKKLLEILKDLYKSVNYSFVTTFSLSAFAALLYLGAVNEIGFFGTKIALSKSDMLILISLVISIYYILINYQLNRIANVYREIHLNANELLIKNPDAKPITIKEIHLYGAGILGFILFLARWQAKRLIENNPFKIGCFRNMLGWLINLLVRSFFTALLFLFPIILVGYFDFMEFFYKKNVFVGIALFILAWLFIIALSTIINGLYLFVTYLSDLIEILKKDFVGPEEELKNILNIIKLTDNTINSIKMVISLLP